MPLMIQLWLTNYIIASLGQDGREIKSELLETVIEIRVILSQSI